MFGKTPPSLMRPLGVLVMHAVKERGGDVRYAKVDFTGDNECTVSFESTPVVEVIRTWLVHLTVWPFKLRLFAKRYTISVKLVEVYDDPVDSNILWYKGMIDGQMIQLGFKKEGFL